MAMGSDKILFLFIILLMLFSIVVKAQQTCGCDDCNTAILDKLVGLPGNPKYSCGARIAYLQTVEGGSMPELEACARVAGEEFPTECGPYCDPSRCALPMTPFPTISPLTSIGPLYCFPSTEQRMVYKNMWKKGYTVEVKERNEVCGPGFNSFGRETVMAADNSNELTLMFKKIGSTWKASEVRVLLPFNNKYQYGLFKFHVKSIQVMDGATDSPTEKLLPKDIVLGLFTWDPTDRYVDENNRQNWMHEVDIEISRWDNENNADVQFLTQPPWINKYRFYSGADGSSYSPSDHWYTFEWLPDRIIWTSTAGADGGQTHIYTVEEAVNNHVQDYVQCLPKEVEVRINVWNKNGLNAPDGLFDSEYVKVVIDKFIYKEKGPKFINQGEVCGKHCQCEGQCINGSCEVLPPKEISCGDTNIKGVFIKWDGKRLKKTCSWVKKKAWLRCRYVKHSNSFCPEACKDFGGDCANDATGKFKIPAVSGRKKCTYVANDPNNLCIEEIPKICRATCAGA